VAADKSDEQGVLGNLPRSRPGRRSAKRGSGSRTAATAAPAAKRAPSTRAKAARAKTSAKAKTRAQAKPSRTAAKPKPVPRPESKPTPPFPEPQAGGGTDPLTGAVRLAGKVAEVGLKTAGGLLKRLPGR
jgi:hypothetical protein